MAEIRNVRDDGFFVTFKIGHSDIINVKGVWQNSVACYRVPKITWRCGIADNDIQGQKIAWNKNIIIVMIIMTYRSPVVIETDGKRIPFHRVGVKGSVIDGETIVRIVPFVKMPQGAVIVIYRCVVVCICIMYVARIKIVSATYFVNVDFTVFYISRKWILVTRTQPKTGTEPLSFKKNAFL